MNSPLAVLTTNPLAAMTVLGAVATVADAARRGSAALLNALIDRVRCYRRSRRSAERPLPWREPGYGLPRALAEPEYPAGRERLTAALGTDRQGER